MIRHRTDSPTTPWERDEWAWKCGIELGLTHSARLVLLRLAKHGVTSWPRQTTIAKWTGLSRRTVQRGLDELQERGVMGVSIRGNDHGRRGRDSNLYELRYRVIDLASMSWNRGRPVEAQRMQSRLSPPIASRRPS